MTAPLIHLAARLINRPLAANPAIILALLDGLGERLGHPDAAAALRPWAAEPGMAPPISRSPSVQDGIYVLPIIGGLAQRTGQIDPACNEILAYSRIAADLNTALADPDIRGILLQIDSPGGEVAGVATLARQIRAASAAKPVWAALDESAFSAGYWLAAAAARVTMAETGQAGSIGVIAVHTDQSARDQSRGLAYTPVTAGAKKAALSSRAPLSAEGRETLQRSVDAIYAVFVDEVAAFRAMTSAEIRAQEADIFFGAEARRAGLIDALQPASETLAEMAASLTPLTPTIYLPPRRGATKEAQMTEPQASPPPVSPPVAPAIDAAAIRGKERARIHAILTDPAATGRIDAAIKLATGTDMAAAAAIDLLASLPQSAPTITAPSPFERAMGAVGNPAIGESGGDHDVARAAMTRAVNGYYHGGGK